MPQIVVNFYTTAEDASSSAINTNEPQRVQPPPGDFPPPGFFQSQDLLEDSPARGPHRRGHGMGIGGAATDLEVGLGPPDNLNREMFRHGQERTTVPCCNHRLEFFVIGIRRNLRKHVQSLTCRSNRNPGLTRNLRTPEVWCLPCRTRKTRLQHWKRSFVKTRKA